MQSALDCADTIYAEDTRVTAKLLNHLQVKTPLKRLDENLMDNKASQVISEVAGGKNIAYCTDAGIPGVSDPGLKLVAAARNANIDVEVIPGPTAAITAYVASGFTNQHFYFGAFLPRKAAEIKETITALSNLDAILIFYESPKRLLASIKAIAEVMPDVEIAICKELTKVHEQVIRGTAESLSKQLEKLGTLKGEIVLCINSKGINATGPSSEEIFSFAEKLANEGCKTSIISEVLCTAFDISKNEAKKVALNAKK